MKKKKVLFVCIHNSARSQMAEALLNHHCGGAFEASSAGLEPGVLNPLAVEALREIGLDIAGKPTRSVEAVIAAGEAHDFIVTVCDEASAERCPVFPGPGQRLHWGFPDPSGFTGPWEERMAGTRTVRDAIAQKIRDWCGPQCTG